MKWFKDTPRNIKIAIIVGVGLIFLALICFAWYILALSTLVVK